MSLPHHFARRWKPLLAATLLTAALTTGAIPAEAQPAPSHTTSISQQTALDPGGNTPGVSTARVCGKSTDDAMKVVPVIRWGEASSINSIHTRVSPDWKDQFSVVTSSIARSANAMPADAGTHMWALTADLANKADTFCAVGSVGLLMDTLAAKLGEVFFSGLLLTILGVVAFAGAAIAIYRGRHSTGAMKKAITKVLIMVAFVALGITMVDGASKSNTTTDGQFVPGAFSPGWMVATASNLSDTILKAPLQVFNQVASDDGPLGSDPAAAVVAAQPGSCSKVLATLRAEGNKVAPVSTALSSLWESTALRLYIDTQFGQDNPYGEYMYCRALEAKSGFYGSVKAAPGSAAPEVVNGVPMPVAGSTDPEAIAAADEKNAAANAAAAAASTGGMLLVPGSHASLTTESLSGNEGPHELDQGLVGWAVCRPSKEGLATGDGSKPESWIVTMGSFNSQTGGGKVESGTKTATPDDCVTWWTKGSAGSVESVDAIDYDDGNSKDVAGVNVDGKFKAFLLAMHVPSGGDSSPAMALGASGLCALLTFGLAAGIWLVLKLIVVVMAFAAIFAVVHAAWKGDAKKALDFGKKWLGFVVISQAFGVIAILPLVILTRIVTSMIGAAS